jgi:hypothetical protein
VSDDFTWQPDPASRRLSVRVAIVLFFAGLGVVAGSLYPIKLVITAFERASLPRVSARGNETAPAAQEITRATFSTTAEEGQRTSAEPREAPSQAGGRIVLLNPGSAEPIAPNEPPTRTASAERLGSGESNTKVRPPAHNIKPGERNVLVVVRRRGPPYDTKILRGRIRDGQLIVNARDRRGIALH